MEGLTPLRRWPGMKYFPYCIIREFIRKGENIKHLFGNYWWHVDCKCLLKSDKTPKQKEKELQKRVDKNPAL